MHSRIYVYRSINAYAHFSTKDQNLETTPYVEPNQSAKSNKFMDSLIPKETQAVMFNCLVHEFTIIRSYLEDFFPFKWDTPRKDLVKF